MSDTSSPLPADDNNMPGKDNEQAQQNELSKNILENAKGTGLNARQTGKILQDEGEDSNHAPSVAR